MTDAPDRSGVEERWVACHPDDYGKLVARRVMEKPDWGEYPILATELCPPGKAYIFNVSEVLRA